MKLEKVKPKVVLLGYTMPVNGNNAQSCIAAAGKLCYSNVGALDISNNLSDEEIEKFVNKLSDMGHYSPFEHLNFTFAIEGISRACSHQIVRHRTGSFSQQSQRYVDLSDTFKYILPPEIEDCPEAIEKFEETIRIDLENYIKVTDELYKRYINVENMTTKTELMKAKKKALEDARYLLPNACETKMVLTMDARNLIHFFNERCCMRAQWEIRDVAIQMLDIVLDIAPYVFSRAGAPCAFGKCPEGQMSCGKKQEPRIKQKRLEKK